MRKKLSEERCMKLLKSIESFLKAEEEELTDQLQESEFDEIDFLVNQIEDFETKIKGLLDKQKKHFINYFKKGVQKDISNVLVHQVLLMILSDATELDKFEEELTKEAKVFLDMTISELTRSIMNAIDEDVAFNILSKRTTDWIEEWSSDLGRLMRLDSHKGVEKAIIKNLNEGKGIAELIVDLENLPQFDYVRARRTAITETLTAYSQAQYESYSQSPAVEGKTWKHSGGHRIKPRPHHQALSGTTVHVDEYFVVGNELAMFPRDTDLSAGERVNCHCTMGPSVSEAILGLTKEEKEFLRQQALNELGY